jgi:putative inorganic carbon (HCO3(-)) transporter
MSPHALALFAFPGGLGVTSLLLYLVAALAIPLSLFVQPRIGLYVLIPMMPLQTVRYQIQVLPFGDKLVDILLLSVILGLLIWKSDQFPLKTPLNSYLLFFCLFLYAALWIGSLVIHMPWPLLPNDERFVVWKNTAEMPLLFLVVASAIDNKRQMQVLLGLMMITVLRANIGFFHTVSGRDFTHFSNNLRYAGVLGYAGQNGLAAFMSEFLIFLLAVYSGIRQLHFKALVVLSIMFSAYCVLFSFSRGGYVSFLAGLLFLGVLKERKYLVLLILLVFGWQTIVPNAVRERVLMTYDGNQVESSANERLQLWQDALTIIPEHPILGTGFDTYRFLGRSADYLDTHNYYVKVTVETGFIGLFLFLYLLWLMVREGLYLFRKSEDPFFSSLGLGVSALVFSAFFANLFGDRWMYQQITAYMWTIMALVCRARVILHLDASTEVHATNAPGILTPHSGSCLPFCKTDNDGKDAA